MKRKLKIADLVQRFVEGDDLWRTIWFKELMEDLVQRSASTIDLVQRLVEDDVVQRFVEDGDSATVDELFVEVGDDEKIVGGDGRH
ncbi:hypothetical protein U1Q18_013970 [Sarracenia purpurea var. burkii]